MFRPCGMPLPAVLLFLASAFPQADDPAEMVVRGKHVLPSVSIR